MNTDPKPLTNSFLDTVYVNLGLNEAGHGPYVIRQEGYPPGSIDMEMDRYVLMKDGTWVLNYVLSALPEPEADTVLFDSIDEALQTLESLAGHDVKCRSEPPDGMTLEQAINIYEKEMPALLQRIQKARAERFS